MTEITIRNNEPTLNVTPAAPASVAQVKGIMASARAPNDFTLSHAPTDSDIVDVPMGDGIMSMPIKTAILHGFLKKNPDGSYSDARTSEAPSGENTEDAPALAEPEAEPLMFKNEVFDEVAEVSQGFAEAGLNPGALIGAVLARPDSIPPHFEAYAAAKGLSVEEASAKYQRLRDAVNDALDETIFHAGISPEKRDDFWQWFHTQGERVPALTEALVANNTRTLRKVVERFNRAQGSGRGSATKTEMRSIYGDQVETVTLPGGIVTTLENARRLGFV